MKQKVFRRIWILVLTLVVLTATVLPASAATATQDGLVVTLTTDKQKYSANETITVTMTVENKNTFPMEGIKLDYDLPSGYNFKVEGGTSATIAKLGAGEKASQTLTHTPSKDSSNAQTGDNSMLGAWFLLAVLSAALVTVLTVLYKKNARVFSMLLCLVLVASMLPIGALAADATKTITLTETIKVDGKDVAVKGTVTYTVAAEEPEATKPTEPAATTAPTEPAATTAPTEPEATTAPTEPEATKPTEPEEPAEPLNLANMQIVLPKDATAVEETAADELNLHFEQMIGKELEVVTEGSQTKSGIYIGETDLAKSKNVTYTDNDYGEGWAIKAVDGNLILRGGTTRGVLYAVYHLLEDEFGVHWWNLWETHIPDLSATGATLPADFSSSGVPAMEYRDLYIEDGNVSSLNLTRNRLNGFASNSPLGYGGEVDYGMPAHCHTFARYFPVRYSASSNSVTQAWLDLTNPDHIDYFDAHPEWYAWSDANQARMPNGQLCLSNEGLYAAFEKKLLQTIAFEKELAAENGKEPPVYYSITPNDTQGHCECDACTASMAEHGPAGHLLQFVNRLAKAVRDASYTDVLLEADAYSAFVDVPVDDTVAAENVTMRFSDNWMDIMHAIDHPNNEDYRGRLEGWSERYPEGNLYLWDYGVIYSNNGVFPTMYNYGKNFAKFAQESVNGYFGELEECINTDFWDMKFWLLTKLMEDPSLACDANGNYSEEKYSALMDEFIYGYYGAAGEYIREFLDLMDEKAQASDRHVRYNDYIIDVDWLTVEDILAGVELFEQAFEAAGDDEVLQRRLRAASCGFDRAVVENFNKWKAQAIEKNIELTIDRQEIGFRLATGLQEQIEQRGDLDVEGESLLDRYIKYLEEPKPLPEELQNIDREHIYDYSARTNTIYNSYHSIKEDPDSLLGEAIVVNAAKFDDNYGEDYRINYYSASDTKGLILSLWTGRVDEPVGQLFKNDIIANDGKYHLYKFEDHLVENSKYKYVEVVCRDSTIQNYALAEDLSKFYGKRVDFYLSMKVTGNVTCQDPNNYPVYYIDRVFVVDHCEVSESVPLVGATCTQNGTRTGQCIICGNEVTATVEGTKLPHSFVDYKPNDDGTETAKCEHGCETEDTRTIEVGTELPDELANVRPGRLYEAEFKDFIIDTVTAGESISVVEDIDSHTGTVIKVEAGKHSRPNWFMNVGDTKRIFLRTNSPADTLIPIPEDQLAQYNDEAYHFYKITDTVLVPEGQTCGKFGIFAGDQLYSTEFGAELTALAGKTVDVYLCMKYTGSISDANNPPVFYVDKVFVVDKTEEPAKLPDELIDMDPNRMYKAEFKDFTIEADASYAITVVEDDKSLSGSVIRVEAGLHNRPDWFMNVGENKRIFLRTTLKNPTGEIDLLIPEDQLAENNDGAYHFYKISDVELGSEGQWCAKFDMFAGSQLYSTAFGESLTPLVGKWVDIYLCMKYTGDISDETNPPVFYVDQVIIVDITETSAGIELPDELANVDPSRLYQAEFKDFTLGDPDSITVVEDADSLTGTVVKVDVGAHSRPDWFMNVGDNKRILIRTTSSGDNDFLIPEDQLAQNNDEAYHFYKISDVVLVPEGSTCTKFDLFVASQVSSAEFGAELTALAGKTVDVYLCMKYTGSISDEANPPVFYADKVFVVDKTEASTGNTLPDELVDVDPSRLYQAEFKDFTLDDPYSITVVEDTDSLTGSVVKVDVGAHSRPDWFMNVGDKKRVLIRTTSSGDNDFLIPEDQLAQNNDEAYHFYKISDVVLVPEGSTCTKFDLFVASQVSSAEVGAELTALAGKTVDVYLYMKYTGDISDEANPPVFYADKVIVVDKTQ